MEKNSLIRIDRLETAVSIWEDNMAFYYLDHEIRKVKGETPLLQDIYPAVNSLTFRDDLLGIGTMSPEEVATLSDKYMTHETVSKLHILGYLPAEVVRWTFSSRRVYAVDTELMCLLNTTSLGNITWGELCWPFDTFALSFEEPIKDEDGNAFDFLLVTIAQGEKIGRRVLFCLLSRSLEGHRTASSKERDALIRLLKSRGPDDLKFRKKFRLFHKHRVNKVAELGVIAAHKSIAHGNMSEPVAHSVGRMSDEGGAISGSSSALFDIVARIVLGFCFYISSLPPGDPHSTDWKPAKSGAPDPKAISSGADVCHVRSKYVLSTSSKNRNQFVKTLDARSPRELCAHMRCAHWRRWPGTAHDPNAPKIVYVRASRVRHDRLQDRELHGGTQVIVRRSRGSASKS